MDQPNRFEHLLDLESELLTDESGERRRNVLAQLQSLREDCQAAKRQLCDKDTYRRLEAANVAVNAAIRIVETLPQRHGGN
jgi:hypothetical protein